MKKTIAAIVVAGAFMAPASAGASTFMSHSEANAIARDVARDRYSDTGVIASCRPFGQHSWRFGFTYYRVVCGWAGDWTNDDGSELLCSGTIALAGRPGYGEALYHILSGERCNYR